MFVDTDHTPVRANKYFRATRNLRRQRQSEIQFRAGSELFVDCEIDASCRDIPGLPIMRPRFSIHGQANIHRQREIIPASHAALSHTPLLLHAGLKVSQPLSSGVAIAFPNCDAISYQSRRVSLADGSTAGVMELAAGRALNPFVDSAKGARKFSAGRGELGAARETPSRTNHFAADSMRTRFQWIGKSRAVCPTYATLCRSNGTCSSPASCGEILRAIVSNFLRRHQSLAAPNFVTQNLSQFEKFTIPLCVGRRELALFPDGPQLRFALLVFRAPLLIARRARNPN